MLDILLRFLVRLWKTESSLSDVRDIDVIVAISYSTLHNKLANATRKNLQEAVSLKRNHPKAILVFANCAYTFHGAEEVEKDLKEKLLREGGVDNWLSAPNAMNNSIEEACVIRDALTIPPRRILIVTGEMHSRSVRYIWEKTLPGAEIVIKTIPYQSEYQSDQIVWFQRNGPWVWFIANVLRQTLIYFCGLDKVAKMHHGTKNLVPSFRK